MNRIIIQLSIILFAIFLLVDFSATVYAQQTGGISINTDGSSPHPSAVLDLKSTTQGLLIPRMTTQQRDAIANPADGLIILNTSVPCIQVFLEGEWECLGGGGGSLCEEPNQPSQIKGPQIVCKEQEDLKYKVDKESCVQYQWNVPQGWQITSGQGTNEITASSGTNGGNIVVTPVSFFGEGPSRSFSVTTSQMFLQTPTEGTHIVEATEITWNWNPSAGASGYKYNTVNDYATAIDLGSSTTFTQTDLEPQQNHFLYVWAYGDCGRSGVLGLVVSTGECTGCPSVKKKSVTIITSKTARSGGIVISIGDSPIKDRGVVVALPSPNKPSLTNNVFISHDTGDDFISIISNLEPNTTYIVRAYAENENGVSYSEPEEFTTLPLGVSPEVTSSPVSEITNTSAVCGGAVGQGSSPVVNTGFVWGHGPNPTLTDNLGSCFTGVVDGPFVCMMTDLLPGGKYYVCPVAITEDDEIIYGDPEEFITDTNLPIVITSPFTPGSGGGGGGGSGSGGGGGDGSGSGGSGSGSGGGDDDPSPKCPGCGHAVGGGAILDEGSSAVFKKGIVWSSGNSLPTIGNNEGMTSDGAGGGGGVGTFVGVMTNLVPGVQYYVRSYAENSSGVAYGQPIKFTYSPGFPEFTTGPVTDITNTSADVSGTIINEGSSGVSGRGVVWSLSDQYPTIDLNGGIYWSGSGGGTFICKLTGLPPGTLVYGRIFVINDEGTVYGEPFSFTTACDVPDVLYISGTGKPCQLSQSVVYSVNFEEFATYEWTVPDTWSIVSGQGSHEITVNVGSMGGHISVTPSNVCGTGETKSLQVGIETDLPEKVVEIIGLDSVCKNSVITYAVSSPDDALKYSWSVSDGWEIVGYGGEDTSSVALRANDLGAIVSVTPHNACGIGESQSKAVSIIADPLQTSPINGEVKPCIGTAGLIYSVTDTEGVTYQWSVPEDWAITAGNGSSQITVNAGAAYGEIIVTPFNPCAGPSTVLQVETQQTIPGAISQVTGPEVVCTHAQGLTYTATPAENADYYTWGIGQQQYDTWGIVSGQGTNQITVNAGGGAASIYVTPVNACGNGTSFTVSASTTTVGPPPAPAAGEHIAGNNQIVWNWKPVAGVLGYKYNTENDYATAIDVGTDTTITQTIVDGICHNLYVWAYNACYPSAPQTLDKCYDPNPPAPNWGATFYDSRDGNYYKTVWIGNQRWYAENNRYIEGLTNYKVPGYTGNDLNAAKAHPNYMTKGVLYKHPKVDSSCPSGWHVASNADFVTLRNYLIDHGYNYCGESSTPANNSLALALAAPANYWTPALPSNPNYKRVPGNPDACPSRRNISGFGVVPAGLSGENNQPNVFMYTNIAFYWTSTMYNPQYKYIYVVYGGQPHLEQRSNTDNCPIASYFLSVRCVQD